MWNGLEWAAWIISGLIILWMVVDMFRVGQNYTEDTLLSSREGVDELLEKKGG